MTKKLTFSASMFKYMQNWISICEIFHHFTKTGPIRKGIVNMCHLILSPHTLNIWKNFTTGCYWQLYIGDRVFLTQLQIVWF